MFFVYVMSRWSKWGYTGEDPKRSTLKQQTDNGVLQQALRKPARKSKDLDSG